MGSFTEKIFALLAIAHHCVGEALVQHDGTFVPDHVLRVSSQVYPQACYYRQAAVINGSSPGPAIRLKPNVTSWVRVYNDMENQNLTMHWHGLAQALAPFSDGTPIASQWPIPPLHYFDYELHPDVNASGTYFYHSHVGFQANSAHGALIVEDHNDTGPPFAYDEEKTIILSEFYNRSDTSIETGLLADPLVWSGSPTAFFVNGRSIAALNQSLPPQQQQNCGYEVIHVKPSTSYRFRYIGAVSLSVVSLGIENHPNLTVIQADAQYTQPMQTDYLQLGSGQRLDIQLEPRAVPSNLVSYACLSYDGKGCGSPPSTPRLTLPADFWTFLEYKLAPLVPNDFPVASDVTRRVTLRAEQLLAPSKKYSRWTWDNNTWTEASRDTPWLVDIYKYGDNALPSIAAAKANDSYIGAPSNLYMASVGEVLEIVLINEANGAFGGLDAHPIHLHGAHFYDLGSGYGDYDADVNNAKLAAQGHTPVKRDVTFLYKYTDGDDVPSTPTTMPYTPQGWRAWRLRVDDPGVWMLHCHILQHMVLGMQTVWAMGTAKEITRNVLPGDSAGYLRYGGSVYGNETWDPIVHHYFNRD